MYFRIFWQVIECDSFSCGLGLKPRRWHGASRRQCLYHAGFKLSARCGAGEAGDHHDGEVECGKGTEGKEGGGKERQGTEGMAGREGMLKAEPRNRVWMN